MNRKFLYKFEIALNVAKRLILMKYRLFGYLGCRLKENILKFKCLKPKRDAYFQPD